MNRRGVLYGAVVLLVLTSLTYGCSPKKASQQSAELVSPQDTSSQPGQVSVAQGRAQETGSVTVIGPAGFNKSIYFDFDAFELSTASIQALSDLVAYMKANPDLMVEIAGHCDERGTNEYNIALGDKRAKAAQEYCISQGIDPKRITTISFGEEKPSDPASNEEAWAKNRRDEFVFGK